MTRQDSIDVLAITDENDAHYVAVAHALRDQGAAVARINLTSLRSVLFDLRNGQLHFSVEGQQVRVSSATTVWWRRAGSTSTGDLDPEEARLVTDENFHALVGALDSVGVRWIDHPDAVAKAERKLHQLAVAQGFGIEVPESVLTNSPDTARRLASTGPVVTKALSPGRGIAPHTGVVPGERLDLVANNPSLLQRQIDAVADLRVVCVAGRVWTWRRPRTSVTIDWREEDPHGDGFALTETPDGLADLARAVNGALGLTTGIQDWLETADSQVFLEVNPQGNWLFLPDSEPLIASEFARLLGGTPAPSAGEWPKALRRLRYDFRKAKNAPAQDGIKSPQWLPPRHLRLATGWPQSLDVAKRAHDMAQDAARVAEDKSERLLQRALALIALAVALFGFQIGLADSAWQILWAGVPLVAVGLLTIAALQASQIDRVGMYASAQLIDVVEHPRNPLLGVLEVEEKGRFLARWTANHKLDELLQARAWFSRGLVALILSGLIAAMSLGITNMTESDEVPEPASELTTVSLQQL